MEPPFDVPGETFPICPGISRIGTGFRKAGFFQRLLELAEHRKKCQQQFGIDLGLIPFCLVIIRHTFTFISCFTSRCWSRRKQSRPQKSFNCLLPIYCLTNRTHCSCRSTVSTIQPASIQALVSTRSPCL